MAAVRDRRRDRRATRTGRPTISTIGAITYANNADSTRIRATEASLCRSHTPAATPATTISTCNRARLRDGGAGRYSLMGRALPGLDRLRVALHFVRAVRDHVGRAVTDVLPLPRHVLGGPVDTRADPLVLVDRALAEILR